MPRRVSLTRYRFGGIVSATIAPGWLTIYAPASGAPAIFGPGDSAQQGLAGFIDMGLSADAAVGDFLYWSAENRWFQVLQVVPMAAGQRALVSEISGPIPDEFAYQQIEGFWFLYTPAAWEIQTSDASLKLNLMPAGTLPSAALGAYQDVMGDFDVWSRVKSDQGSAGNGRFALLGARDPNSLLGIYIGTLDDDSGVNSDIVRLDEYATSTLASVVAASPASATYFYVRLQRRGARFRTFYKTTAGEPTVETDWSETDQAAATSFVSSADLRVGLWGYTNNSTQGDAFFQFFRNWNP